MGLGKNISKLRNEKNLNQRELAQLLGVSNGAVGMWETGKRQPDLDTIKKIASLFDVTVDYLLGDDSFGSQQNGGCFFFFFDDIRNIFVERLNLALTENNMTVEDLSNSADIDINKCSAYSKGNCEPPLEHLVNIANSLRVSTDYLLGQIDYQTEKTLASFRQLNEDNRDICIGEIKRSLRDQRREESGSVAADSSLKKAK